jgi:hypothetical protein
MSDDTLGLEILAYRDLTIWPDCSGELLKLGDEPMISAMELTFVAIVRAHADNELVRGLVLAREESASPQYVRVGMFQVREQAEFETRRWNIETIIVV